MESVCISVNHHCVRAKKWPRRCGVGTLMLIGPVRATVFKAFTTVLSSFIKRSPATKKVAILAQERPSQTALQEPAVQIRPRIGKGVSCVEDGIPCKKSDAATVPMPMPVLCGNFRPCNAGMLKLCRIGIAVDFHGSYRATGHVKFSTIDTIDDD